MPLHNIPDPAIQSAGRNYGKENPFAGTQYESLWVNNPYANLYYEPSFWDNIGLSNKAKDTNAEYERLYNEYISGIYDLQREDSYNSPSAEAQRYRQAGMNPDLLGLSGHSNSEGMTPPNAGINPALNGQSPAINGFNIITSVLGFATSAFSSISQIRNLASSTESNQLSNFGSYLKFAEPHIVKEYASRFSNGHSNDWSDVRDVSSSAFPSTGMRRNYKQAFDFLLSSSRYTAAENAYKSLSANDRAMKHFIGGIVDLELESLKSGYKADIRSNNNRGWLDKWRNEFYNRLYKDFKDGSDLAGLILIGAGSKFNALGLGLKNHSSTSWLDSDINWNDSVITGIGKKFNLW